MSRNENFSCKSYYLEIRKNYYLSMKDVKINRYLYEVGMKEKLNTTYVLSSQETLFKERHLFLPDSRKVSFLFNLFLYI